MSHACEAALGDKPRPRVDLFFQRSFGDERVRDLAAERVRRPFEGRQGQSFAYLIAFQLQHRLLGETEPPTELFGRHPETLANGLEPPAARNGELSQGWSQLGHPGVQMRALSVQSRGLRPHAI